MAQVTLGRTGITVDKNGFGALPIQRIPKKDAVYLLRKAFDSGITFFDTARGYTDSEDKLCEAFHGIREKVYIATKSGSRDGDTFRKHLDTSLKTLGTDYIDLMQFHNPPFCPKPGDGTGMYEAILEAKKQGKIRWIGFTSHRLPVAHEVVDSNLYDTLQFPFSYLASDEDVALVEKCRVHNMGFLAMKALSGGLISNSAAAYAYLAQFDNVLPIWGIQRENELDEFISYIGNPPELTPALQVEIDKDRESLLGNFCRACGYCMPCPVGIEINLCARMSLLIRRAPPGPRLSEEGQAMMKKVEECLHCNQCVSKCPYELDPPRLLEENYRDYQEILAGKAF